MGLKDEIYEQVDVLESLLTNQYENARRIAASIRKVDPNYIFLAARGTSDNAGRYASYLWGAYNRLPVALIIYVLSNSTQPAWFAGDRHFTIRPVA